MQQLTKVVPITRYQFGLTAQARFHGVQNHKPTILFVMICLAAGTFGRVSLGQSSGALYGAASTSKVPAKVANGSSGTITM